MMKKRLFYLTLLLIVSLPLAQAEIYKWVDDNGQVHYSEKAPDKKRSAEEIHLPKHVPQVTPVSPAQRKQKRDNLLRAFEEERNLRKEARAKKEQDEVRNRKNCIRAKDRLRNYERATVLYNLDEKGDRVYLSDAQRSSAVTSLKSQINKWCN